MSHQTELNHIKPTPGELKLYNDFTTQMVKELLPNRFKNFPPILWHYTRGDALIKIIESGTLWATQVSCMNDQVELRYAQTLFHQALKDIKAKKGYSTDQAFLLDMLVDRMADESSNTSEWFITCFSAKADDLSQWRAYGGGEGGYSLGFDIAQLENRIFSDQAYILPVCYNVDLQRVVAEKVANATLDFFASGLNARRNDTVQWREEFLDAWGESITYLAPLIKHQKFEDENEWRVVRRLRATDRSKMKYTQKQALLARHLPLTFQSEGKITELLPLVEIQVGPTRNPHVSKISVADLLLTKGYPENAVPITTSEVPFQQV